MTVQAIITADNHLDPSATAFAAARQRRKQDHLRCFEEVVEYARRNRPDLFLICGDLFDVIRPSNTIRARLMDHFRALHEAGIHVFMVGGHHDTPKSQEDGISPLAVYGRSGYAVFFDDPVTPTPYRLEVDRRPVQIYGVGHDPFLAPGQDPLTRAELKPQRGVNILLTHYPIEGFKGYLGDEPFIRLDSIPRAFNLVAAGHFHNHQSLSMGGTRIVYPGSTERASFAEEGEEKGFVWADIGDDGEVHIDFIETSARPFKTLQLEFPSQGSPLELLKERLSGLANPELVLRVRLGGRVRVEQLAAYRRHEILSFARDKFFHFFIEEEFDIEAPEPLPALPKTTPLEELRRYFEARMAGAAGEERAILEEALRLSEAKLEEAGAW